ncbi:MAG: LPS-assembly protein LptD [Candidatus Omnitrophica bacterium]|nr:LPS-assembly protein LptD [Candidatus Omnitrophota bacterium]
MSVKSFFVFLITILLFSSVKVSAAEQEQAKPIRQSPFESIFDRGQAKVDVVADSLEYSKDQQKVIAKGNVVIRYQDRHITADYAEVETQSKKAYIRGHVIIFKNNEARAQGEEITYDFETESGNFQDGRSINFPWFTTGDDIKQVEKGVQSVKNGCASTCGFENPNYDIKAKKLTIYENDKMIAWNVKIYILGKPVFWLPYLIVPLNRQSLPLSVTAGYNSRHGAYIETSKGIAISKNLGGQLHADWRSKRGFGGGLDLGYDYEDLAQGEINTYWTEDERAPTPGAPNGNPYSQLEDRDRGRITWRHRTNFDPHFHVILRYNRLADEYFLQDFFEKEFRASIEPQSFVTLTRNTDRFGFLAHVQKRMNRFESIVERLPQVRYDWKNQQFFSPWVYSVGHLSFDNLSKRFGRSDRSEEVVRMHGTHEWRAPINFKNIKFTPHAGLSLTSYSRDREQHDARFRTAFDWGLDLRTHFYRTFSVSFDKLGVEVNNLRHIIEPVFSYQSTVSTVSDEKLQEFDSTDRIDDANVFRFGLENRLQTRRVINGRMQRVDLVSVNTYLSYEAHPDDRSPSLYTILNTQNVQSASSFTLLNQEVVLRPYDWLRYRLRFDYDMHRDVFRVLNQDLLAESSRFRVLFGHRFVKDIGSIEGSNQFVFEGKWTVNPRWALGGYIRWDAENGGELEEWQVSATRDLDCFLVLDFGFNVRNSSIRSANKELYFNLKLKPFPDVALRSGRRAAFAAPRIGETVAGASQSVSTPYQFAETA